MLIVKIVRRRIQDLTWLPRRSLSTSIVQLNRVISVLPDKQKTIEKFDFNHYTHTIQAVNKNVDSFIGSEITLNGWLDGAPRKISKNLIFAHFRDFNGDLTQIVAKDSQFSQLLRSLKPEDSLSITGNVGVKKSKDSLSAVKEWELNTTSFQVLNNANVKVTQLDSLKSSPSAYPPQYRYLQLRLPYYQRALKMRAKAAKIARSVLDSRDFTEIETPLLFKSTPEGAKEFLVPTRRKGYFYALPQSPQQYKQLLMAGGFKGYYQIAKCFRDEDLRADRQPEFTQIDLEMSFGKGGDVRNVVEDLVSSIWKGIRELPLYKIEGDNELVELKPGESFPKLDYITALSKYGIDKPDLRSTISFKDISSYFENGFNDKFPVIEACVLKGALNDKKKLPSQLFETNEYKVRKPYIFKIKDEASLKSWSNNLPVKLVGEIESLNNRLGLEVGDIVSVSDRATLPYENPTPLGRFRQLAIQHFPNKWRRQISTSGSKKLDNPDDIFVASWVVNFPLFSPIEQEIKSEKKQEYPVYDQDCFESTHHPFTMVKLEDYDYLSTEPLKAKGDHYDLVINGVEVGGGSRRVHDAELQKFIFTEILNIPNPMYLFGHLLNALSSGCPPHAGLAIGFDRMCSMLLGSSSIRDVVAFPKTQAGADPVVESPSEVPTKTLDLYGVSVKE